MPPNMYVKSKVVYGGVAEVELIENYSCRDVWINNLGATVSNAIWRNPAQIRNQLDRVISFNAVFGTSADRNVALTMYRGQIEGDFHYAIDSLNTREVEWIIRKLSERYPEAQITFESMMTGPMLNRPTPALRFKGNQQSFAACWWAILLHRTRLYDDHDRNELPESMIDYLDGIRWRETTDKSGHMRALRDPSEEPQTWRWLMYGMGPVVTHTERSTINVRIRNAKRSILSAVEKGNLPQYFADNVKGPLTKAKEAQAATSGSDVVEEAGE